MHSRVSKTHSQCLQKCYIFAGSHFLVQQRVCDNQDFVETEQLKAYSRVLQIHVHFICSVKKGQIFLSHKLMGQINHNRLSFWFAWFLFIHRDDMCKECCKFIFMVKNKKMPLISWTSTGSYSC